MSDTIERLGLIKRRHDFYNRLLTLGLVALVCAVGGTLTLVGVPLVDRYPTATGIAIMFAAFVFYKVPYFSYRLTRRRFAHSEEDLQLMGGSWRQYKLRILNQPIY